MAFHKALKDLNLLDRFLFAEAMEDPVIMQMVLEIILGREIILKYPPQTEKEQRKSPLLRYIRLDVWAMDTDDTVYDTETVFATAQDAAAYVRTPCYLAYHADVAFAARQTRRKIKPIAAQDDRAVISINYF